MKRVTRVKVVQIEHWLCIRGDTRDPLHQCGYCNRIDDAPCDTLPFWVITLDNKFLMLACSAHAGDIVKKYSKEYPPFFSTIQQ